LKFTLPELTCQDVNIDVEDVNVKNNQVEKSITKKPFLADYKKEADKSGKWDGGLTEENAPVIQQFQPLHASSLFQCARAVPLKATSASAK
jgi:hypothetical protein